MTTKRPATIRTQVMRLLTTGAFLAMLAATAVADDTQLTQQPFQLSLGTFTNEVDTTIRADGETTRGTEINWGNTFGDVDGTRFRVDGYWRINDRHHLRFMYTDNSAERTRSIDRTIEWKDRVFLVNTSVKSEFGFKVAELAYEYDFSKKEDRELVLSFGLHYTEISARLSASITTPGGGVSASDGSEAALKAPLPVIGARGMWNLGGKFWLDAQAQYFQISFDDIDGSILNYRAAFIWQPMQWFGVGAGYDSFGIDVDAEGDRLTGTLDWTYSGPQVFFNFAF